MATGVGQLAGKLTKIHKGGLKMAYKKLGKSGWTALAGSFGNQEICVSQDQSFYVSRHGSTTYVEYNFSGEKWSPLIREMMTAGVPLSYLIGAEISEKTIRLRGNFAFNMFSSKYAAKLPGWSFARAGLPIVKLRGGDEKSTLAFKVNGERVEDLQFSE